MGTFKHEQRACGHESSTVAAQGLGDDFVASRSPSSRAGGGAACSRSDERETRRRGLTDVSTSQASKSGRPLTGRRNCAIYTPVGLMAGVFLLIANTLVWPVESLSSSITSSSAEPSGGILHLRGGENPTTPMKAPLTRSKRTYTEAASPPARATLSGTPRTSLSLSGSSEASWAGPSRYSVYLLYEHKSTCFTGTQYNMTTRALLKATQGTQFTCFPGLYTSTLCGRFLTYAEVCRRMQTHADVCGA
jgi:hypothetical protein